MNQQTPFSPFDLEAAMREVDITGHLNTKVEVHPGEKMIVAKVDPDLIQMFQVRENLFASLEAYTQYMKEAAHQISAIYERGHNLNFATSDECAAMESLEQAFRSELERRNVQIRQVSHIFTSRLALLFGAPTAGYEYTLRGGALLLMEVEKPTPFRDVDFMDAAIDDLLSSVRSGIFNMPGMF